MFSGTSDTATDEVTRAGFACDQSRPAKGFRLRECSLDSAGRRLSVDVYVRSNGDVAGVDMTSVGTDPADPDALMSFLALGLGGAMGPDAFNAVSDAVSARLDGSSPAPVWVSPDLRVTVRVIGSSAYITVLAADLAAAWGS